MSATPYDVAFGQCAPLTDAHILIPTKPWLEWCQNLYGNHRLFCVANLVNFRFSLACWVWTPAEAAQPLFIEIDNFAASPCEEWPSDLTPPVILRSRLKPLTGDVQRPYREMLRQRNAQQRVRADEERRLRADKAAHWLRRGRADIAHKIRTGQLDVFNEPDATMKEVAERLLFEAKRN